MEAKTLQIERGKVFYWLARREDTQAPCLVFTHGLTADHTLFDRQVPYFSREYSVLTWDVPLHGCSRPYVDFSYRHCAEDLRRILEREHIGRVVLIGMSMGGYPCQEFAWRYPELVAGFVALDTTPYGRRYYSRSDLWWLKQAAPLARLFPENALRRSMSQSVSRTAYAREKMLAMLGPLTKAQIIEQMDIAYGGFARENRDIRLACPVLILLGEFDQTGKVRQYCEAWAQQEGYPLHIIKNAAHFANGDNPEQVNAEIQTFIHGLSKITTF